MAANLNTPADFLTTKATVGDMQTGAPDVKLLPPSAFGVTPGNDGWRELAEATKEVVQLTLENQRLKETHNVPIIVPAPAQDIRVTEEHTHIADTDRRYIDELLKKQATEIGDLQKERQQLKVTHHEEMATLEREHTLTEKKYIQEIATLEATVKGHEDRYDSQVSRLSYEHQTESEEMNNMILKLKEELNSVVKRSSDRVTDLETQLKVSEDKMTLTQETLQKELRSKEFLLENQQKQISQLRNYIGDTEHAHKSTEVWKKENDTLRNKLQICKADRDNHHSNLQLLNIRLSSIKEILRLQEAELSRTTKEKSEKEQKENLLTRWREKVFMLLVQQKSAEMNHKKNEHNWKAKVSDIRDELTSVGNQKDVMSHSLSDLKAQLDMETNNNKKLEQDTSEVQNVAVILDQQLSRNRESVEGLASFSDSVSSAMEEKVQQLTAALGILQRYSERVSFASGRVEMLQGLYARRDALLQRKMEAVDKRSGEAEQALPNSDAHLREELDRVTSERDTLAAKLREDSQTWDERVEAVTATYKEEISCLRKTVEDLEFITQDKSQRLTELTETCAKRQTELDEAVETVEALKTTVAHQEINCEQAFVEQRTALQTETAEELADLNRKLDDARREHTKAVVALRQLERQTQREKERSAEHLVTVETHYTKHIAQLQQQLLALEKDRNLMMATLRQEGLIGKVKATRSDPITLDLDDSVPQREAVTPPPTLETPDARTTDEPLTAVLEDLRSLTSAVLKEDVSDSDSDV